MHINGWYRLGIVASIAYALYGGDHEMRALNKAASAAWTQEEERCAAEGQPPSGFMLDQRSSEHLTTYCMKRADTVQRQMNQDYWWSVGMAAFLPVVMGWIVALIGVFTCRWVWRGFRPKAAPSRGTV